MKHSTRILAYSALALIVMLAAFGAITFDSSNVAYAQTGTVPAAPTLTATSSGPNSITITWDAVPSAVSYELWSWDNDDGWQRLDGGADDPPVLLTGTSFVHTGLMSGKTYYYQMQAFDSDGDPSGWSDRVNEVAGDAPDAPVLTPAAGYEQITVSWPAVTDAVSYELHAWDGSWTQLADANGSTVLTATSYTHTGLTAGSTIYYQGRSVNAGGTMSAWSVQVNATVLSAPTTGAPQSLTAAASGNGEVTLTWTAPADDGGLGIDGYHYQYGETGNLGDDWNDAGDVLTVTISNLTNGTAYDFEVRAFNSGGNGPAAMVSAMPVGGSGALQSLAAVATSHNMVTLTWTAPSDTGGLAITGYDYRSYETGGTPPDTWEDAGNVLTVDVTGLTKNTDYTFEVRAMNSAGSGPAATATATTLREPDAPATLTAASGNGQVTLTWTAPANDGGLAVTGYEYRSYETGGTAPDTWKNAGDVLTVDITGLTNRTEYTFEVRALNPAGSSAVESVTETPSSQPSIPQNLTATGGHGTITLSWDEPSDNGGTPIERYEVQKYNATSTDWVSLTTSLSDTEYPDNSVTIGATTDYRVRAINANTNDPSDWATVSGVAQGQGVPSAPQNVKGTPSNGQITFSWDAPASDGGSTITKYEYKYWLSTAQEPTGEDDWKDAGLSTSRTILNLTANSQYNFVVRAVNDIGNGERGTTDPALTFASTRPDLPRRFEAQADLDEATIELSWREPDDDGGDDLNGYELEFSTTGDDGSWADVDTYTSGPNTDDADHGTTQDPLLSGQTYYYRVRALNDRSPPQPDAAEDLDTDSDLRDWRYANATTPSAAPDTPEVPVVGFADGRITVTWEAPRDNGETITRYRLRWRSDGDTGDVTDFPAAHVVSVDAPAIEYIMIGPDPDENYLFQVQAINVHSEDDSPWSGSNAIALEVPAPTAQPTATNNSNALTLRVTQSTGIATISWRMVSNAPAYTVASYELQYAVEDTSGDTPDWDEDDDVVSLDVAAQSLMQHLTDALPGNTELVARIRVVTTVGTKSGWSGDTDEPALVRAAVNTRAPDNPVLDATIIGQNVLLSWDTPENNGACISQYELQYKKDDGDFGDHDGDDDGTGANGTADPDDPDNDVIMITGDCSVGAEVLPDTSYSHEELEADSTFTYRIRTVTSQNTVNYANTDPAALATALAGRKWSDEAVAVSDPGPPEDPKVPGTPPLEAMADNTDGHIELSWEMPDEGTEPITSYQLQRWNGSAWEALPASLSAQDDEYTDDTAELGQMYYYAIRAVSSVGMGQWTQRDFPDAMLNAKAPAKIDLSLSVDGQAITLSWTAPEDNGNAIVAYQIQVTDDAPTQADGTVNDNRGWGNGTTNNQVLNPSPALSTTYTHSDLTAGRTYYYRIRAVNACNDDDDDDAICGDDEVVALTADDVDWSDEEDETAEPTAPNAPGAEDGTTDDLTATGGDAEVTLSWGLPGPDNPDTEDTEGTGGASITSVEVQRWNSSTGQWDDIKTVAVGFVDDEADPLVYTSASETYTDADLADGTDYMYRVRAVNAGGESGWSNMASTRTLAAAPALPELDATVNGQSVELSWTEPDANGASITRYEIQRFPSIDADNTNSPPDDDTDPDVVNDWGDDAVEDPTDDDVILPMPAGVREHTDSGLAPNTIYYYRIRAVNACNNETGNEEACGGASGDDIPGADTAVTDTAREWSATVTVTTAPQAPARIPRDDASTADVLEGLRLTGGENEVKLEWIEPDPNGSPISEYQIDRWDSVDRQWIPVKRELPASVKTYTDTGLAEGTRYFYRVRAVNAGGEGPWSTLTSAMTEEADE